jgi:glycosyltransferase involved in cell wall biosynthesis
MKILIVTNYLPPKIGGIERFSHGLASALKDIKGVEVSVASARWSSLPGQDTFESIAYPYDVLYFPSISLFRRLPVPNLFKKEFWAQVKDLNDDFDLVFYQSHLFILNWIIAIKLRNVKRRVWMNHGCNYVPLNSKVGILISLTYERLGMALMKVLCNEFVGQSSNAARWISSKVGTSFWVLSNATNLDSFQTGQELVKSQVRTKVLFVGRLVEGKGLRDCVLAVSKANEMLNLKGDSRLFTLTIVGAGPLSDQILKLNLNVEIDFWGESSHSKVIESMYESDILIQAYTQPEGLTTVTLEGLSTGLLIVTTPLSGGENLQECVNYISGNLNELPSLLLRARDLPESRDQLLTVGRRFIENGLTWDAIAQRLIQQQYSKY